MGIGTNLFKEENQMGLMKGGAPAEVQAAETAMSAEQQREIKNGMILNRLRRYWRMFCIGACALSIVILVIAGIIDMITGKGDVSIATIAGYCVLSIVGWAVNYVIILYIVLYIFAFRFLQVYFYLKDLFGGNKETRL